MDIRYTRWAELGLTSPPDIRTDRSGETAASWRVSGCLPLLRQLGEHRADLSGLMAEGRRCERCWMIGSRGAGQGSYESWLSPAS